MISLSFEKLYCTPRLSEPCYISIPFAKGKLYDIKKVAFYQEKKRLSAQVKVTSSYDDGSIRYLFARFLVDLPANQGATVECLLEEETSESFSDTNVINCHEIQEGYEISTGVLSFTVTNDNSHLFTSLDAFGKHYSQDSFIGPELTATMGSWQDITSVSPQNILRYTMHYNTWKVIETGAVCTILSCEGNLVQKQSEAPDIPCEIRVTAYTGKPWIDISVRITNASDTPLVIDSYSFSCQTGTENDTNVRTCVASSNYRTVYDIGEHGETVKKEVTPELLLNQGNEHFAEVLYGTFFADVNTPDGGVCASVYQAFQNYPKAVRATAQGIELYLVPKTDVPVIMQSGMAREQRFQLLFHDTDMSLDDINNRSLIYQMPDRPVLSPEAYQEACIFPDIFVQEAERMADVEIALITCADSHARAYGMMNWGDAPDPGYTAQGKGQGKPVWTNNEYDFPHACMLLHAMTGQRRFLDYCLVAGSHQMDVDVCHYSKDPLIMGGQWEHTRGHVLDGAIVCSHEWVEGLLNCYHATGDERYLHTALGIGDNVLRLLDTPMYQANGGLSARETGWALRTLTALYTETHDMKWVSPSDWIVGQFEEWADRFGGWLAPYTDNVVIRVPFMIAVAVGSLYRYYKEFPKENIRCMILNAVDDMIENCLMDNGLFYYKELPSLNRLGNNPLPLEALAIAYELSGNSKYLQAGRKTFETAIRQLSSTGGGGKEQIDDAVISGKEGTKRFAQSFLPIASFYKAWSGYSQSLDILK